jgi:hypothetical protein
MTTRAIPNAPADYDERDGSPSRQTLVSTWLPIDLGPALRGESIGVSPTVLERTDGVMLFYPSCLNSVLGETESCKTWVALIAMEQELRRGRHVVLIDYEGSPRSIVERLQALGVTDLQISEQFSYIQPDGKFGDLEQALLFEECIDKRGAPSLVIIDGVTEAMAQAGLDPNVGVDVANYFAGAPRWFARQGAAVAMIDHVTKGSENRGRFAIGSERKISGLDGAAYMVDLVSPFGRGKTGRVKLTVSKDRGGYVREHTNATGVIAMIELRSNLDGSITTTVEAPRASGAGPFRPTGVMERMSTIIAQSPTGVGVRELRMAVKGRNDIKDAALEILIREEYVEVTGGAHGAKIHTSLKPYREHDEATDQGGDDEQI